MTSTASCSRAIDGGSCSHVLRVIILWLYYSVDKDTLIEVTSLVIYDIQRAPPLHVGAFLLDIGEIAVSSRRLYRRLLLSDDDLHNGRIENRIVNLLSVTFRLHIVADLLLWNRNLLRVVVQTCHHLRAVFGRFIVWINV